MARASSLIRIRSKLTYTYQDLFGVSSLLPSATSAIAAGRSSAPGVPTISNLLIGKINFNPENATGGAAAPPELAGCAGGPGGAFAVSPRATGLRRGPTLVCGARPPEW